MVKASSYAVGFGDFYNDDVSAGLITGVSTVNKFGRNPVVAAATVEDVWDGSGIWVPPTAARLHDITSTDIRDDASPAGLGARTLEVYGLDASYALQSEIVQLNGLGGVTTANTYMMIHRMIVRSAGATGYNYGVISATAQVDGTITAQIKATNNQTLMAIYQIPADKTGYLYDYYMSIGRAGGAPNTYGDMRLVIKPDGEVFQLKSFIGIHNKGTGVWEKTYRYPLIITEKSIIKVQTEVDDVNSDIQAGFTLQLKDN
jgi:hypothetical protein